MQLPLYGIGHCSGFGDGGAQLPAGAVEAGAGNGTAK